MYRFLQCGDRDNSLKLQKPGGDALAAGSVLGLFLNSLKDVGIILINTLFPAVVQSF